MLRDEVIMKLDKIEDSKFYDRELAIVCKLEDSTRFDLVPKYSRKDAKLILKNINRIWINTNSTENDTFVKFYNKTGNMVLGVNVSYLRDILITGG